MSSWTNQILNFRTLGPKAGRGFNKLHQEVWHHQGGWGPLPCLTTPHVLTNHRIWVFLRKSIFLILGCPKKLFKTQKPEFALETSHLGGGHTSKTFWFEPWFWRFTGLIMPKNCYFAICSSEMLRSKSFSSMTPPPKKKGGVKAN